MTVVVWDGRYLVADKLASRNGIKYKVKKIHIPNGSSTRHTHAIGFTGSESGVFSFMDWVENTQLASTCYPKVLEEEGILTAITVRKNSIDVYSNSSVPASFSKSNKMAWGAGADFAIGAMAAGMNAIQAANISCLHCLYCGLGLTVYDSEIDRLLHETHIKELINPPEKKLRVSL